MQFTNSSYCCKLLYLVVMIVMTTFVLPICAFNNLGIQLYYFLLLFSQGQISSVFAVISGMGTEIQAKTFFSRSYSTRDQNDCTGSDLWAIILS